jgi:hypothetical protein
VIDFVDSLATDTIVLVWLMGEKNLAGNNNGFSGDPLASTGAMNNDPSNNWSDKRAIMTVFILTIVLINWL